MFAHAQLAVTAEAGHTRIARLRSDPPLTLRPVLDTGQRVPQAWQAAGAASVSLAAAAAGPIGGDRLHLDVDVGAGATLVLRTVAATLLLPGPHGESSYVANTIHIGRDATLIWLPEPIIASRCCHHIGTTRIHLDPEARLISREELILGRHGEQPGRLRQRLRVTRGRTPLHDQELRIGTDVPGWQSPAVTGGRTALGNLLVVGAPQRAGASDRDVNTVATMSLATSATLVSALADDALNLRRTLDAHLADLAREQVAETGNDRAREPV